LLEHGDDLAVGKAGLLHGTSSRKDTRKFHFWRLLMGGGITVELGLYLLEREGSQRSDQFHFEFAVAQHRNLPGE
uniref:hypothetical protein n=1 Tax=Xanthomonas phaseoli TaxID=1985254 RepID=UPI001EE65668